MNEKTPDHAATQALALNQFRLLGDLLSCLDAAGYDPGTSSSSSSSWQPTYTRRQEDPLPNQKKTIRHGARNRMRHFSTAWTLPR